MSIKKIKKDTSLRKAILQAAITGKLINQCHSEVISQITCHSEVVSQTTRHSEVRSAEESLEPTKADVSHSLNMTRHSEAQSAEESLQTGKQLLDKIIEERNKKLLADWEEKLKENPKAKKPTPIVASEIEEDEIREFFGEKLGKDSKAVRQIPENWCWCRLGDLIDLLSGRDLEPSAYNSLSKGIPYMTGASNFENEELIVNRWTDKPATISKTGDLLITCKGTIGELAFNHIGDVHIARQIMAIRKTDFISLKFLKFFLISRIDEIQKQAKSMIPGISREDMLGFLFPLPPLAEQKKIVEIIEQMLPLCEKLGKIKMEN